MFYHVVKGKTKYIALAKMEPFSCEDPDPLREPGRLWFDFGETPESALESIKESLKLYESSNPLFSIESQNGEQVIEHWGDGELLAVDKIPFAESTITVKVNRHPIKGCLSEDVQS